MRRIIAMSYNSAEPSSIVTTEDFLENITGWNQWEGGFLEIAIDFREARYFDQAHLSEAVAFAREMASSGHDIHLVLQSVRKISGLRDRDRIMSFGRSVSGLTSTARTSHLPRMRREQLRSCFWISSLRGWACTVSLPATSSPLVMDIMSTL